MWVTRKYTCLREPTHLGTTEDVFENLEASKLKKGLPLRSQFSESNKYKLSYMSCSMSYSTTESPDGTWDPRKHSEKSPIFEHIVRWVWARIGSKHISLVVSKIEASILTHVKAARESTKKANFSILRLSKDWCKDDILLLKRFFCFITFYR